MIRKRGINGAFVAIVIVGLGINFLCVLDAPWHERAEAAELLDTANPLVSSTSTDSPFKDPSELVSLTTVGPSSAPVVVVEYADFQCPYCAKVSPIIKEVTAQYPGQIRVEFKHLPLPIHPDAPLAHEAALAAGAQGKFWAMHDLLYANQRHFKRSDLLGYAQELSLNMDVFETALDSHQYWDIIQHDQAEAGYLGITGTPTFLINGRKVVGAQSIHTFQTMIDEELGRIPRRASIEPASPVSIDISGAPMRGVHDAPITIVEYSDFHCPYCRKVIPTLNEVLSRFPDQVHLVFKHFPLPIHANAPLAHQASVAAGEQGQFWEMHDLLFSPSQGFRGEQLVLYAKQLGLDVPLFQQHMETSDIRDQVAHDLEEGRALGVRGTPTFFINGQKLVGAQPLAEFIRVIERELERVKEQALPSMALGDPEAPVTVTLFGDFQSTLSAQAHHLVDQLSKQYEGEIRVVFKHFPLGFHHKAKLAHEAAFAAGAQGQFWAMHDLLFRHPHLLGWDSLLGYARQLQLDEDQFRQDVETHRFRPLLQRDLDEGVTKEVRGVPTWFINETRVDGLSTLEILEGLIEQALIQQGKRQHMVSSATPAAALGAYTP